jgi:hypothetical protein
MKKSPNGNVDRQRKQLLFDFFYEERPAKCNIDMIYELYLKDEMSIEECYKQNYLAGAILGAIPMIIAGLIMCPKTDKTWRFGRRLLCFIVLTIIAGMLM